MRQTELGSSVIVLLAVLTLSLTAPAARNAAPNDSSSGDFFIISSVDPAKQQLLLEFPTEVTEVMRVDGRTRYFDESGKPINLADLRAGDTVYVTSVSGAQGFTAVRIRKGRMTVEELRRCYLQAAK